MNDKSALDIEAVMSPAIHEPSTKPMPDAEREDAKAEFANWFIRTRRDAPSLDNLVTQFMLEAWAAAWQARARLSPAIPVGALKAAIDIFDSFASAVVVPHDARMSPEAETLAIANKYIWDGYAKDLRKLLESAK